MNGKTKRYLFPVIILALSASTVFAASGRRLVKQGNVLYREGKYNEAAKKYDEASAAISGSPVVDFNRGNCLYENGNYNGALELYEKAAIEAEELELEQKANYNMGNCSIKEGMNLLEGDPEGALEGMKRGLAHYRKALELDPEDEQAKENIEFAARMIKIISEKLKEMEKQKKKQDGEKQEEQQQDQSERSEQQQQEDEEEQQEQQSPQQEAEETEPRDETAQQILAEERENKRERQKLIRAAGTAGVDKPW